MKKESLTIYGRVPVRETLTNHPKMVKRVLILGSVEQQKADEIQDAAKLNSIPVDLVSKKVFDTKLGDSEVVNHQGVLAQLAEFPYYDLKEFVSGLDLESNPALIILDEIQDTHNVGAIIRSAAASGIAGVIIPEHRQAPVNSTVFKTSAGTVLDVPIIKIGNVNQALEFLKEQRFWTYALVQNGDTNLYDYESDSPSVFVVGNEGEGVRQHTAELCDYHMSIPMKEGIESLNASVSAALVMYEWNRKSVK